MVPYRPPSIERFVVEPKTVMLGHSAKLLWSTSGDITNLRVTPGQPVNTAENELDVTPDKTSDYKLEAVGPLGSDSRSVTVEVLTTPVASITSSSAAVSDGRTGVTGGTRPSSGSDAERTFADGQLKLRAKQYEEAAVLFGKAARLRTGWKDPLVERGKLNSKLGRFREAIEDFNQALVVDPHDAFVLTFRGHAFQSLNQLNEARADLDEAIRLDPSLAEAYMNRGNLKWHSGDKAGAKDDFAMSHALLIQKTRR